MKLLNAILISSLGLVGLPALAHGGDYGGKTHGFESAPPPPPDAYGHGGPSHRHESNVRVDDTDRALHRGIRSGALTPKEVRRLRGMQERLREAKRAAAFDGRITPSEQRRIARLEKKLERQLERDLHDQQRVDMHGKHRGSHDRGFNR